MVLCKRKSVGACVLRQKPDEMCKDAESGRVKGLAASQAVEPAVWRARSGTASVVGPD